MKTWSSHQTCIHLLNCLLTAFLAAKENRNEMSLTLFLFQAMLNPIISRVSASAYCLWWSHLSSNERVKIHP